MQSAYARYRMVSIAFVTLLVAQTFLPVLARPLLPIFLHQCTSLIALQFHTPADLLLGLAPWVLYLGLHISLARTLLESGFAYPFSHRQVATMVLVPGLNVIGSHRLFTTAAQLLEEGLSRPGLRRTVSALAVLILALSVGAAAWDGWLFLSPLIQPGRIHEPSAVLKLPWLALLLLRLTLLGVVGSALERAVRADTAGPRLPPGSDQRGTHWFWRYGLVLFALFLAASLAVQLVATPRGLEWLESVRTTLATRAPPKATSARHAAEACPPPAQPPRPGVARAGLLSAAGRPSNAATPPQTQPEGEAGASARDPSGRELAVGRPNDIGAEADAAEVDSDAAESTPAFDGYIRGDDVELWGPDAPTELYELQGDALLAYRDSHLIDTLELGTRVQRGLMHGQWRHVYTSAADGWVAAHNVIAAADVEEATVLQPVEIRSHPYKDEGNRTSIEPGMLLLVLGRDTLPASTLSVVRLPKGEAGWIASCLLSFEPEEISVARALHGTHLERDEARAKYASARLAPALDGKPPAEARCGAPATGTGKTGKRSKKAERVGWEARPVDPPPLGLEILGIWQSGYPAVNSPSTHDWKTLGYVHGGIPPDGPLPPPQRQDLRRKQVERESAVGEQLMADLRPALNFDAPALAARGAYYAFTPSAVLQPNGVRLAGKILFQVDCDGCENGPRGYAGQAVLSLPESADAALVVWFPAAVRFTEARHLPKSAWSGGKDGVFQIRIPDPLGELRSYPLPGTAANDRTSITGEPFAIRSAYITAVAESGLRLLVVETNGNPACERGLYLYEVQESALKHLGGTAFACDV